jgi:hypothetical protein
MGNSGARARQIESTTPRAVFAQLVATALDAARLRPSPMATAYLVELLDERVRTPEPDPKRDLTLAEDLLGARRVDGPTRIGRMRRLGDRALFISGFFGDCLNRKLVGIDYYMQIGRAAYGDVASRLAGHSRERTWTCLYGELASHFGGFVDVLADVGDRSRADRDEALLRTYERYLRDGHERDRGRLLRAGHRPPDRKDQRWQ